MPRLAGRPCRWYGPADVTVPWAARIRWQQDVGVGRGFGHSVRHGVGHGIGHGVGHDFGMANVNDISVGWPVQTQSAVIIAPNAISDC